MLTLVLGTAVEVAARRNALAAREMNAALGAAHHVFRGAGLRRAFAPPDPLAEALENPAGKQQAENNKDDFPHALRSMRM